MQKVTKKDNKRTKMTRIIMQILLQWTKAYQSEIVQDLEIFAANKVNFALISYSNPRSRCFNLRMG